MSTGRFAFHTPPLVVPEFLLGGDYFTGWLLLSWYYPHIVVPGCYSSTALSHTPPVWPLAVKLCLDEPLLSKPDVVQLVALCAMADTLIERVQKIPRAADNFDLELLQQIEGLCKQVAPKKAAQVRSCGLSRCSCRLLWGRGGGGGAFPGVPGSSCNPRHTPGGARELGALVPQLGVVCWAHAQPGG